MPRQGVLSRLGLAALGAARADSVTDFYSSHPVQLVVGYGAGGGYDAYARRLAPFIARRLPGEASVVVVNMPGAASLRAANYIHATAPRDGATFGAFSGDMPLIAHAELPYALSRPFAAPPDLPPDRAKALRTAFLAAQKDPGYLAAAAKLKVDVSPIGGAEAEEILARLAAEPPDLLDELRALQSGGDDPGR